MQVRSRSTIAPPQALLLVGLLLGTLLLGYALGSRQREQAFESTAPINPGLDAVRADSNEYDLPALRIELEAQDYAALLMAREQALELGHIASSLKKNVPARIGDQAHKAKLRLKGDLLDHVNQERWSMRISLKDESFEGMQTFSVQDPSTRGYLWEWLGHQAARREGLLAPRSMFVSTSLQGVARGVYFLEEHFTKDLLESHQRREGPIVKFDEEIFWAQANLRQQGAPQAFAADPSNLLALPSAFDEEQLTKSETLARELSDGLARMDDLMQAAIASWEADHPLGADRMGQARLARSQLWRARAAWVEDLVDLRQAAKMHALMSLLHSQHGLASHNLRFYFDPVAAKLEPIFFDAMAMKHLNASSPVALDQELADTNLIIRAYRASPLYRETFAIELGRMLAPGYLEDLLRELGPELSRLEALLERSGPLPTRYRLANMKSQLIGSRATLRKTLYPATPLAMAARHRLPAEGSGTLEIDLWPTSEAPVVAEAFIFENGLELPALDVALQPVPSLRGGALLMGTAQRQRFSFDANARLAGLVKLGELLANLSHAEEAQRSRGLGIKLRWRYASETATQELSLDSRLEQDAWWDADSRPRSPSLSEALAAHPFLRWDATEAKLWVLTGRWNVRADLVIPEGLELHAQPGAELLFEAGAVFLSHSALLFEATEKEPIRLGAQDSAAGWAGVVVLDAPGESRWRHVWVSAANFVQRAGWITSGGCTFYRSALMMTSGGFLDARGEDALNLFGTTATLRGVHFSEISSDALDADFVQLNVEGCHFERVSADAIDTSGSQASIMECQFIDIGDKCVSAGERSRVTIESGSIQNAAIGVAAKDLSEVEVQGLSFSGVRNFALCAYRKKAVYGPASIHAKDLQHSDERAACLAQTGSSITLDGIELPTQDFDPKELYSDGILGN